MGLPTDNVSCLIVVPRAAPYPSALYPRSAEPPPPPPEYARARARGYPAATYAAGEKGTMHVPMAVHVDPDGGALFEVDVPNDGS
eukprot:gene23382-21588_t